MKKRLGGSLLALLALVGAPARAEHHPAAGLLENLYEPRWTPAVPDPMPVPDPARSPVTNRLMDAVPVQQFVVQGAQRVRAAELEAVAAPWLGKVLTPDEADALVAALDTLYRSKGWLVRFELSSVAGQTGSVLISVVEGRLSRIVVEGADSAEVRAHIERILAAHLQLGDVPQTRAVEKALLLVEDITGANVAANEVRAGAQANEAEFWVSLDPQAFYQAALHYSNDGAPDTGTDQVGAHLGLTMRGGQQLNARLTNTLGANSAFLGYALPLGVHGLKWAVHMSELQYRISGDALMPGLNGRAQSLGSTVSWPWLRGTSANVTVSAGWLSHHSQDFSQDQLIDKKSAMANTLAVDVDWWDAAWAGAHNEVSVGLVSGQVELSDAPLYLWMDGLSAQTQGAYRKWQLRWARQQHLSDLTQLHAVLQMQVAEKNLDASEKMSLGGPNGVRAYPLFEGTGDEGWVLNLESRHHLAEHWSGVLFVDYGHITVNHTPWPGAFSDPGLPNAYDLAGAGVGLSFRQPGQWQLDLSLASPVGPHPAKQAGERNQDGSKIEPRAWLRVSHFF